MAVKTTTAHPFPLDYVPKRAGAPPSGRVTITPQQVAEGARIPLEAAQRLLGVVGLVVARYAPEAPEALLNEAVLRGCGWLANSQLGMGMLSLQAGHVQVDPVGSSANWFTLSGGRALLGPYRVRKGRPV